jgi:hydrogenase maturation protease
MNPQRILIAGIGNIFLGDDAFGVEVAQRLLARPLPDGVQVVDFGIRGLDLTYALLDGYDIVILVDATERGQPPGTLYLIEPEFDGAGTPDPSELLVDPHSLDPAKVLRLAHALGGRTKRVILVGCEPLSFEDADAPEMADGLSAPVQAAVLEAVKMIESLIVDIRENHLEQVPG